MRTKRLLAIMAFVICSIAGTSVYAANHSIESKQPLLKTNLSRHYIFTETGINESGEFTSQYEVWFDEKGQYRFNTIGGPFTGDYEVWDGKKLYQYTKAINELTIRNINGESTPIPHLYLSPEINARVLKDIKKGKLQSISKNDFQSPGLHVKLDDEEQTVMYSQHQIDGKATHTIKIDVLDKGIQFDKSLLDVDQSNVFIHYLSE